MPEPRVSTELYTGPLDLLLYLCRRAEVDIYNLPIAEIAEQYIKELEAMQVLDLEYAGEFLTMAASLLKLKSDLVLAQSTQTKEAEAERAKLVRQLLEYKRLRDLAYLVGERFAAQSKRHGRPNDLLVPPEVDSSNDTYVENVSPVDLYRAWARLEGEIFSPRPTGPAAPWCRPARHPPASCPPASTGTTRSFSSWPATAAPGPS